MAANDCGDCVLEFSESCVYVHLLVYARKMPCLCMSLIAEMLYMLHVYGIMASTCVLGQLGASLNSCNIRIEMRDST